MKILKVEGIHCSGCTDRINKALDNAKIDHIVSLENKTVSVNEEDVKKTIEELDDLGFDAVEL